MSRGKQHVGKNVIDFNGTVFFDSGDPDRTTNHLDSHSKYF